MGSSVSLQELTFNSLSPSGNGGKTVIAGIVQQFSIFRFEGRGSGSCAIRLYEQFNMRKLSGNTGRHTNAFWSHANVSNPAGNSGNNTSRLIEHMRVFRPTGKLGKEVKRELLQSRYRRLLGSSLSMWCGILHFTMTSFSNCGNRTAKLSSPSKYLAQSFSKRSNSVIWAFIEACRPVRLVYINFIPNPYKHNVGLFSTVVVMNHFIILLCSFLLPSFLLPSFLLQSASAYNTKQPKLCVNCKHFIPDTGNGKYGRCVVFPRKEGKIHV